MHNKLLINKVSLILGLAAVSVAFSAVQVRADPSGNAQAGKGVFEQNCIICHGATGMGDGPGSAALNPKPANFNDHARFSKIDEATRFKAVTEGGASVGASPFMPPFKDVLSEDQVRDVLAYIRTTFTH